MPTTREQLAAARTEYRETKQRLRGILDAAIEENRGLTRPEQERETALTRTLDTLEGRIEELQDQADRGQDPEALRLAESVARAAAGNWLPSRSEYRRLMAEQESRAVSTTSGGAFISQGQYGAWFDRLRARSVVLAANPTLITVEMGEGSVRVPKITASVTVSAVGENAVIAPSDPTVDSVVLTPRKLAALTLVSNEAVSDSKPELRRVVAEDLIRQAGSEIDRQFLVGDGVAPNMRGLVNTTGSTAGPNLGANGGTPTLDNFADCIGSFEAANADLARAVWIMAPRTWGTVRKAKDAQSRYQVNPTPSGAEDRSLFGVPVRTSTNVPVNLTTGTSTDTSWVLLADMSQVVVGRAKDVEVAFSTDFAFDADQLAIRVLARFDIGVVQPASLVVMTGVRP